MTRRRRRPAEVFGTTAKLDPVDAALQDAVKRRKRESFLDWLADGGLPELTRPVPEARVEGRPGGQHAA